jgi:phage FluMu protein Com
MLVVERKEKYYLSCPCCNKLLFRYEGSFSIEVKCSKCNRDIVVLVHGKETTIFENRRHGISSKRVAIKETEKLAFVS